MTAGLDIAFASAAGTLAIASTALFGATVRGFAPGDVIDFGGIANSAGLVVGVGPADNLTVTSNGTLLGSIALDPNVDYSSVLFGHASDGGTGTAVTEVTCFVRGTRIATPDGPLAVEDLRPGGLVLTVSGKARPVEWIGRRRVDCARHPAPHKAWPVRIAAGAFGKAMPVRDLLVSPAHAIYVDTVFIPAKCLVNGTTVTQEPVDDVEYFHVELPTHDVLLSEGLPTESYLENGDRHIFENGGAVLALHPDMASPWAWEAESYAPMMLVGPEVEAAKARLAPKKRKRRKAA